MSHWNYRIIRKYHNESDLNTYQIYEVYYDDKDKIEGWTESPVEPMGESVAELCSDIHYFLEAFQHPILTEKILNGKETLVVDENATEINEGHHQELLERFRVANNYLHKFIGSHPIIRKNEELSEIFSKAKETLSQLCQHIGALKK